MSKLSPIDFKIGLPIILKVNDGQNQFELHISKHSAKIASFWPKIGQLPLGRATFYWEYIGQFSSVFSRRIEWCQNQTSISFSLEVSFWT